VATRWPYYLPGESLKKTAITEMRHAEAIAEQVVRLGGDPTTQPAPFLLGESAEEMLEIDREQERAAIELYKRIIDVADTAHDDAIVGLFERILADEEKHHQIFSDLLEN
jgi:bacterioferritin